MKRSGRELLLRLAVAGMEVSWLFALALFAVKLTGGAPTTAFGLTVSYFAAFGINMLLVRSGLRKRYIRILNVLLWLFTMQLILRVFIFPDSGFLSPAWLLAVPRAVTYLPGVKPELAIFLVSAVFWGLGYRLSGLKIDFAISVAEFQFGLAFVLVIFFSGSQIEKGAVPHIPVALTFVVFSIFGMSVAHAESGASWLGGRNRSYWLEILIITIVLVVVIGLLVAFLITPEVLRAALSPVRWFLETVDRIGIAAVTFLSKYVREEELPPEFEAASPAPAEPEPEWWKFFKISIRMRDTLRLILVFFWIALVVFTVWRASLWFVNLLRRRMIGSGAETEHLDGAFRTDLLGFIRWLLRFLRYRLFFWRRQVRLTGIPEIDCVRGIYRELLRWAAGRGLPRFPFQTPFEYLYALEAEAPALQQDLRFITGKYVDTRYGSIVPDEGEISELKRSWQRVKETRLKKVTPGGKELKLLDIELLKNSRQEMGFDAEADQR